MSKSKKEVKMDIGLQALMSQNKEILSKIEKMKTAIDSVSRWNLKLAFYKYRSSAKSKNKKGGGFN